MPEPRAALSVAVELGGLRARQCWQSGIASGLVLRVDPALHVQPGSGFTAEHPARQRIGKNATRVELQTSLAEFVVGVSAGL